MISRQGAESPVRALRQLHFSNLFFAHMWNASCKANEALLGAKGNIRIGREGKVGKRRRKSVQKVLETMETGKV